MAEMVVRIPEELKQEMDEFSDVEWEEMTRKLLSEELKRMRELKSIVSKSKLTERDVGEISSKVDEALSRRFRELQK